MCLPSKNATCLIDEGCHEAVRFAAIRSLRAGFVRASVTAHRSCEIDWSKRLPSPECRDTDAVSGFAKIHSVFSTGGANSSGKLAKITTHRRARRSLSGYEEEGHIVRVRCGARSRYLFARVVCVLATSMAAQQVSRIGVSSTRHAA